MLGLWQTGQPGKNSCPASRLPGMSCSARREKIRWMTSVQQSYEEKVGGGGLQTIDSDLGESGIGFWPIQAFRQFLGRFRKNNKLYERPIPRVRTTE
jgi:hypothetical protein